MWTGTQTSAFTNPIKDHQQHDRSAAEPETASAAPRPCGSRLGLAVCCGRYHSRAAAPSAEPLMRSRYAAYALGRLD
ncbi:hypothetical protein HOE425_331744 [Hoeflea sp. EC-HK425]|nr:hypothetical protein HOE425_331744 [Hoeflea sp. EC-HK425]